MKKTTENNAVFIMMKLLSGCRYVYTDTIEGAFDALSKNYDYDTSSLDKNACVEKFKKVWALL